MNLDIFNCIFYIGRVARSWKLKKKYLVNSLFLVYPLFNDQIICTLLVKERRKSDDSIISSSDPRFKIKFSNLYKISPVILFTQQIIE